MDLSGRPRQIDFSSRIGSRFRARASEDGDEWVWTLEICRELPKPALEALAELDCFTLEFSGPHPKVAAIYHLEADDGFTADVFAVPAEAERMFVTIN